MNFNVKKRLSYPTNITVSIPRNIKKIMVTWNHVKVSENKQNEDGIVNIGYNVYRGTSINGIYYKLNKEPIFTNRYEDNDVSLNPNTRYWYKVSTISIFEDGIKSESLLSEPIMYQVKNENKWFSKVNERNMWILKNTGVLMDLYVRKTTGNKCPECWDDIRGQSENTSCKTCFGTGIIGGYEPMFQLYIRQKPAGQQIDISGRGYMINSNPGAWTISTVQIKNRDILINPEGQMFSVTNSHINHAAGYYFHQELQTKELDPMDARYDIKRETLYPEF